MTNKQIKQVIKMHQMGATPEAIGLYLSIAPDTVCWIIDQEEERAARDELRQEAGRVY